MITLREITASDSDQIFSWRTLPEVAQYMYSDHEISKDEHNNWFHSTLQNSTRQYWIIELDGEGVGVANITDIDNKNRSCFWAFYLASPIVRGKGVGSFVEYFVLNHVFDVLKLNKLSCEVFAFNQNVIDMHKKFGFKEEGIFKAHIFKNGEFHDIVRLAMLQQEWVDLKDTIKQRLVNKGLI